MIDWFNLTNINAGFDGMFLVLVLLLIAWSLTWKGLALWHAARLGHKAWFVALLVVNTLGILEIIYIFVVAHKHTKPLKS